MKKPFAILFFCLVGGAHARTNDICGCVTVKQASKNYCVLAPASGQRQVGRRELAAGGKCTMEICEQLYTEEQHKFSDGGRSPEYRPITCNSFAIDPTEDSQVAACNPNKPVMVNLSLTSEFDGTTSVNVPAPYQPVRFDANSCQVDKIAASVEKYVDTMKAQGCSCNNLVLNINSHGDGVSQTVHQTVCRETGSDGAQQNRFLRTRDLLKGLQAQLKKLGCQDAVTTVDNCFSSKAIEDLRGADLPYPVLTSSHSQMVAPGESNFWTDYAKWCNRCDANRNQKVTLEELRSCIPKGEPTFLPPTQYVPYYTSVVVGPWAMSHPKDMSPDANVLLCAPPVETSHYYRHVGLRGRELAEENAH